MNLQADGSVTPPMDNNPERDKTDMQRLCDAAAAGEKPDRELVKRVRERSALHRRKFDYELSLELLREARDE
jgi:20S proteasome alpha/beta subunit